MKSVNEDLLYQKSCLQRKQSVNVDILIENAELSQLPNQQSGNFAGELGRGMGELVQAFMFDARLVFLSVNVSIATSRR